MLPITLTKRQNVLIVGAGRACAIKIKVLKLSDVDITIVSQDFKCDNDMEYNKIVDDFYNLEYGFFDKFDLIYIAIKLDDTSMVKRLQKTKLINVLSNPNLSNFIHPCSRFDSDIVVSVNSINTPNPKQACMWANKFIEYKSIDDTKT